MYTEKTYYLINGYIVGKKENDNFYLMKHGLWIQDDRSVILDYLMGYDESESVDSPYRFGNISMIDKIEEIDEEMVNQYKEKQIIGFLKEELLKKALRLNLSEQSIELINKSNNQTRLLLCNILADERITDQDIASMLS